jgi:hypothetical protein
VQRAPQGASFAALRRATAGPGVSWPLEFRRNDDETRHTESELDDDDDDEVPVVDEDDDETVIAELYSVVDDFVECGPQPLVQLRTMPRSFGCFSIDKGISL